MTTGIVIIHGAGKMMSDYYKPNIASLAAALGAEPPFRACWYSDITNIGSPVFDQDLPPEALEFRVKLGEAILEDHLQPAGEAAPGAEAVPTPGPEAMPFGLADDALFVADLIADVTRYLYQDDIRGRTQSRLVEVLEQANGAFDETMLVSHSLGTVVAYDVLSAQAGRLNVSQLVTMGSPLRKVVNLGARAADPGQIALPKVRAWRNLYDSGDPVANVLGPSFQAYPVEDIFVDASTAVIPAHDYWGREKVVRMLAGWMG